MTTEHEATRTLVKSPPELWVECSDPDSLARHLSDAFGEIRITRLEPETAVAWEGARASGTVRIEPSAWGTRVTLTAQTAADEAEAEPTEVAEAEAPPVIDHEPEVQDDEVVTEEPVVAQEIAVEEEAAPVVEPEPAPKLGVMVRLRALFRSERKDDAEAPAEPPEVEVPEVEVLEVEVLEVEVQAEAPEGEPDHTEDEPEVVEDEPEVVEGKPADTEGEPPPAAAEADPAEPGLDPEAALTAALDSLGQAHHRPFSRA